MIYMSGVRVNLNTVTSVTVGSISTEPCPNLILLYDNYPGPQAVRGFAQT